MGQRFYTFPPRWVRLTVLRRVPATRSRENSWGQRFYTFPPRWAGRHSNQRSRVTIIPCAPVWIPRDRRSSWARKEAIDPRNMHCASFATAYQRGSDIPICQLVTFGKRAIEVSVLELHRIRDREIHEERPEAHESKAIDTAFRSPADSVGLQAAIDQVMGPQRREKHHRADQPRCHQESNGIVDRQCTTSGFKRNAEQHTAISIRHDPTLPFITDGRWRWCDG